MYKHTNISNEVTQNDIVIISKKAKKEVKYKIPEIQNENFKKTLTAFLQGKTLKSGNYVATENALVYRSLSVVDDYIQDVICIRLIQDGTTYYLGNSSRLNAVGTSVAFGKRTRTWGASEPQRILESMGIPMLPFQAFNQAGLKVVNTKILEQSGAETVKRKTGTNKDKSPKYENVHFTGASLFQNGNSYFLFDIDRVEIAHGIFNPFIVELPREVKSISEAYDSLIPLEVRTAKIEGKEVLRQGEHFFIKVADSNKYKADSEISRFSDKREFKEARLSAQGNRDHVCSFYNEKSGLVSGFVKHQGREHLDLDLTSGWYKPVPNTAVKAFTITGDID